MGFQDPAVSREQSLGSQSRGAPSLLGCLARTGQVVQGKWTYTGKAFRKVVEYHLMNVLACSSLISDAVLGEMPLDVPLQKQCEELKSSLHCFLQRIEEKGGSREVRPIDKFVCSVYSSEGATTIPALCWELFRSRYLEGEKLPPTRATLMPISYAPTLWLWMTKAIHLTHAYCPMRKMDGCLPGTNMSQSGVSTNQHQLQS